MQGSEAVDVYPTADRDRYLASVAKVRAGKRLQHW